MTKLREDLEEKLLRYILGDDELCDVHYKLYHMGFLDLVDIAIKECFVKNTQGEAVDVLRKLVQLIRSGVYRSDRKYLSVLEKWQEHEKE